MVTTATITDGKSIPTYDNFPILSKVINTPTPKGWLKLALWLLFVVGPACMVGGLLDLSIMFAYQTGKWLLMKIKGALQFGIECFKKIINHIIDNFIAKVLAITAILVMAFFVFFLCYTGTWRSLLKFCSELF